MARADGWRRLGSVLAAGAVYDFAFGVGILAFLPPLASVLRLEVPPDPVYVRLNGVFLLIIAAFLAAAAREPERYRLVGPISAGGRILGFLLFFWAWTGGAPATFLGLGIADLVLAAATLAVWRRAVALSD